MVKKLLFSVIAIIILLFASQTALAQSAQDAYKAMLKLKITMEEKLSLEDYRRAYRDAKTEVSMYLKSKHANQNKAIKYAMEETWAAFSFCDLEIKVENLTQKSIDHAAKNLEALGKIINQQAE